MNSEVKEIVVLSGIRELKFGTTPSTCVCLGNLTDAPPNLPVVSALLPASNWNPNPSAAVMVLSPLIFAAVIPLLSVPVNPAIVTTSFNLYPCLGASTLIVASPLTSKGDYY